MPGPIGLLARIAISLLKRDVDEDLHLYAWPDIDCSQEDKARFHLALDESDASRRENSAIVAATIQNAELKDLTQRQIAGLPLSNQWCALNTAWVQLEPLETVVTDHREGWLSTQAGLMRVSSLSAIASVPTSDPNEIAVIGRGVARLPQRAATRRQAMLNACNEAEALIRRTRQPHVHSPQQCALRAKIIEFQTEMLQGSYTNIPQAAVAFLHELASVTGVTGASSSADTDPTALKAYTELHTELMMLHRKFVTSQYSLAATKPADRDKAIASLTRLVEDANNTGDHLPEWWRDDIVSDAQSMIRRIQVRSQ